MLTFSGALVPVHRRFNDFQTFNFVHPPDPDLPELGLAEIYWADLPRGLAKDGYTLEETKAWAETIVERLQCRQHKRLKRPALTLGAKTLRLPKTLWKTPDLELSRAEFKTVKQVLTEMIESIGILEHLVAWLEKSTKFRFPLKQVLIDYVDDVQVVAEYRQLREQILKEFYLVMGGIIKASPACEIYIVAHSEGTVVSFLALLQALKSAPGDPRYDWVQNVKGFMTFGSPIGKHLALWPELWTDFEATRVRWRDLKKIPWFNYYDYGDPIGFELNIARRWMADKAQKPPFEFPSANDIGFSRYPFPGKAHNDYWRDDVVFQHFIGNDEGGCQPACRSDAESAESLGRSHLPLHDLLQCTRRRCSRLQDNGGLPTGMQLRAGRSRGPRGNAMPSARAGSSCISGGWPPLCSTCRLSGTGTSAAT